MPRPAVRWRASIRSVLASAAATPSASAREDCVPEWIPGVGGGPIAGNVPLIVFTSHEHDDGTGPALYVGGQTFTTAGGQPANRVAKWNGKTWSAVGDGFANGIVWKLAVFNDGTGDALYAFGTFTASGATPINRMAK